MRGRISALSRYVLHDECQLLAGLSISAVSDMGGLSKAEEASGFDSSTEAKTMGLRGRLRLCPHQGLRQSRKILSQEILLSSSIPTLSCRIKELVARRAE
jgi:hypothetical protein